MHLLDFLMHHLLKICFARKLEANSVLELLGGTETLGLWTHSKIA